MGISRLQNTVLLVACISFTTDFVISRRMRYDTFSTCYTANGRDYEGTQNITYVRDHGVYEGTEYDSYPCLLWTTVKDSLNMTEFDNKLPPENYCRNPNNKLFPYCYIDRGSGPEFAYCHIPSCKTPALLGCFKLKVRHGGEPAKNLNLTSNVILDGKDSMIGDPQMKIGRCLNYCRSRSYNYAGVTGGESCLCGSASVDGGRLEDPLNQLKPRKCLEMACRGDRLQACGGKDAIAIYDVEAGSCEPPPHYDKDQGVIYSPRWPGNYHNEAKCQWTVYVPEKYMKNKETRKKYQMHITFSYFHLEKENDILRIYAYHNYSSTGGRLLAATYSGSTDVKSLGFVLNVSEIIAIHMVFNTDKDHKHEGFIMNYKFVRIADEEPATTKAVKTKEATTIKLTTETTTKATTKPPMKQPKKPWFCNIYLAVFFARLCV